jgi:hypothetical protein
VKPRDYTFVVNLSTGNTSPEYNVIAEDIILPVNTMPAPLMEGDTFTFCFNTGSLPGNWALESCSFYCWPVGITNGMSPFNIGSPLTPIGNTTTLTQNSKITIKPTHATATDKFSLWCFALAGLCRLSTAVIPFFIDPEAACSSGA